MRWTEPLSQKIGARSLLCQKGFPFVLFFCHSLFFRRWGNDRFGWGGGDWWVFLLLLSLLLSPVAVVVAVVVVAVVVVVIVVIVGSLGWFGFWFGWLFRPRLLVALIVYQRGEGLTAGMMEASVCVTAMEETSEALSWGVVCVWFAVWGDLSRLTLLHGDEPELAISCLVGLF